MEQKKAFEFIIKKYSDENISPLKNLLSGGIFKMFDSQIKSRAKKKKTLMLILLALKLKPKITEAALGKGNIASIKVKFSSEQVQVIKNEKGKIVRWR